MLEQVKSVTRIFVAQPAYGFATLSLETYGAGGRPPRRKKSRPWRDEQDQVGPSGSRTWTPTGNLDRSLLPKGITPALTSLRKERLNMGRPMKTAMPGFLP